MFPDIDPGGTRNGTDRSFVGVGRVLAGALGVLVSLWGKSPHRPCAPGDAAGLGGTMGGVFLPCMLRALAYPTCR
jgi:hypothetical protein